MNKLDIGELFDLDVELVCSTQVRFLQYILMYLKLWRYEVVDEGEKLKVAEHLRQEELTLTVLEKLGHKVEGTFNRKLELLGDLYSSWNKFVDRAGVLHYYIDTKGLVFKEQQDLIVNILAIHYLVREGYTDDAAIRKLPFRMNITKSAELLINNFIVGDLFILNYVYKGIFRDVTTDLNLTDFVFAQWHAWIVYHLQMGYLTEEKGIKDKETYIKKNLKEGDIVTVYTVIGGDNKAKNPLKTNLKEPLLGIFRGYKESSKDLMIDCMHPSRLVPRFIAEERQQAIKPEYRTSIALEKRRETFNLYSTGVGTEWLVEESWVYPLVDNYSMVDTFVHTETDIYSAQYTLRYLDYIFTVLMDYGVDFDVIRYIKNKLNGDLTGLPEVIRKKVAKYLNK